MNEGKVIQNTLKNLSNLPGRKQIIAIDDDSDDDTLEQIQALGNSIAIIQRQKPNARTGKGDVLNAAMPFVTNYIQEQQLDPNKCIVGVIDADGVLSPNSFDKLNEAFLDNTTDAVQLRVKMKSPRRVLQTFQDIEFFIINHLTQILRSNIGAVALCGNAQFFRYSTVTAKLGYIPWGNALLEDYELTLQLELKGLKIRYIGEAYVSQEALLSVKKLIVQRSRWAQGGLNCWKYLKRIVTSKEMSTPQKLDTYFFFFNPVLNFLADFSIIYLTITSILSHDKNPEFIVVALIASAIIGLFFGTIFSLIYLRELRLTHKNHLTINKADVSYLRLHAGHLFLAIALVSYVYVILFFSLLMSLYHQVIGQNTWVKTKRV